MLQAQEQNQEQTQDQNQLHNEAQSEDQSQSQSPDQQQIQTQGQYQAARPNEDQQVIQALQYESRHLRETLISVKIEGAKGTGIILTAFLALVTIVRFFVRRRRLAALKSSG